MPDLPTMLLCVIKGKMLQLICLGLQKKSFDDSYVNDKVRYTYGWTWRTWWTHHTHHTVITRRTAWTLCA